MYPWNVVFAHVVTTITDNWTVIYGWSSFVLAVATNISAVIASSIMFYWYFFKLTSKTPLRPLIGSIALAKANLWFWSASNMAAFIFMQETPPPITFPSRVIWLIVIIIQLKVTLGIRPSRSDEIVAQLANRNKDTKILILEDDVAIAELYTNIFTEYGYTCSVVTTGAEALAFLTRHDIKIVIVDIKLPDMTGIEFMSLARQHGFVGHAIAISGAMTAISLSKLQDFAMALQKPIRTTELIEAIEALDKAGDASAKYTPGPGS